MISSGGLGPSNRVGIVVPVLGPQLDGFNEGTITTMADLLGRTAAYTDIWGDTTTTYDQPGRVVSVERPGSEVAQALDGTTLATASYTKRAPGRHVLQHGTQ